MTSLHTRGVVAMAGTFGYELDPGKLTEEEKAEVREQMARYKEYASLIQAGEYYRLSDPFRDVYAAWAFIERLWKFVKGELRSKYYDDFAFFKQEIDSIIDSTSKCNKGKVSKLIGQKVQLFDDLRPVCKNTFIKERPHENELYGNSAAA